MKVLNRIIVSAKYVLCTEVVAVVVVELVIIK